VKVKMQLKDLAQHLREDVAKIDEPKAQALFETSAAVLDRSILWVPSPGRCGPSH
jgi:hypothetical protein